MNLKSKFAYMHRHNRKINIIAMLRKSKNHATYIINDIILTCMSIEVPVVRKNNPRSNPLNGLMSASIWVLKFVSAKIAPAKKAPSCIMIFHTTVKLIFNLMILHNPKLKILKHWKIRNRVTKSQILCD